jgi:hypothetical protein
MNGFRNVLVVGFIGVVVLLLLSAKEVGSRASYRCLFCRLKRSETKFLGTTRSNDEETDCSRWYRAHVEPAHAHIWELGSCTALLAEAAQHS